MKIHQIQTGAPTRTASSSKLDLDQFTADLRELSERHGLQLVSIGAMSTVDLAGPAYLAIWATEAEPTDTEEL